jgi:hypothetical protein
MNKSQNQTRILITINHLVGFGGSEKYVLQLIIGLLQSDYSVFIHARHIGHSFQKALELGAFQWTNEQVDFVVINHNSNIDIARKFRGKVPVVMICHGIYPYLEQPISGLSWYFGVSDEVTNRLQRQGLQTSTLRNPVGFLDTAQIEKTVDFLILSQGSEAINILKKTIPSKYVTIFGNKHDEEIVNIEEIAGKSKVIIGSGRTIVEGAAAKCAVVLFESRHYDPLMNIGQISIDNWRAASYTNYSGREMSQLDINNLADVLMCSLETSLEHRTKLYQEMRSFHHTKYIVDDLIRMINLSKCLFHKRILFLRPLKVMDLRSEKEKRKWETPAR